MKGPRCEVCKSQDNLCVCGGYDEPMLLFCPAHYIEHVDGAHGGYTMPGCTDLATAKHLATVQSERERK